MLAIIPARKGSKGLKNKSFRKVGNKSLIENTFYEAKKSKKISKIIVTSNDRRVLDQAKKYNVDFLIKRKKKLCLNSTLSDEYLLDVCNFIKKKKLNFKDMILLQPTSPLRTSKDIDRAIIFYKNNNLKNLISVTRPLQEPSEMIYQKNKKINFIFKKKKNKRNKSNLRQSYFKTYFIDGSIYIINLKLFEKTKKLIQKKANLFELDKLKGIDINDRSDLKLANVLHKFR